MMALGEAIYKIICKTINTLLLYSLYRVFKLKEILVQNTRVLRPSEYKKILKGCQKQDLKTMLQALLYTGMRYIELKRFQSYPSWYDGVQFIHLPRIADRKVMRTQNERFVRLSPPGRLIIEYFLQLKRSLPSYQTWQENMNTWAKRGNLSGITTKKVKVKGIPTEVEYYPGLCAKTTRKSIESWLMFYYPQRAMEIALSQGHTTVTSLQHYLGMPFNEIDRVEMAQFIEGW